MLNTTKKTVLVLALALAPLTAFAQTTDTTNGAAPATTTAGTTDTTSSQNNSRTNYGWLGLLGLAGLAGLRRQAPPVVVPDRNTTSRV